MALQTQVLHTPADFDQLREAWDGLVLKNSGSMLGHDATSSFAWFEALLAAFPNAKNTKVVVVRRNTEIVALLPVVAEKPQLGGRRLFVPTVLYGGRNGFLLSHPAAELLAALLAGIRKAFGPWLSLRLWLVDQSESARILQQTCANAGYQVVSESGALSPHFPLLADAAAFHAGMSKGLKQRLKAAPVKFSALGQLVYQELVDETGLEAAMQAILAVEQGSWKQQAGTAITCHPDQERFYRALLPRALRAGILYGQILYLDEKPIAFSFGLVLAGVFSSLKHSQTTEFERLSPSHLLNAAMILKLRDAGVTTFDFMGESEPHKLQWSDATGFYQRQPVLIYSPSLYGRVGFAIHEIKRLALRAWKSRQAKADAKA